MKQPSRNQRLAAIHMGKTKLGLDDDTYRDMLEQIAGKRSAKDLNDDELVKVLQHLESLGFTKREFGKKPKVKLSKEALLSKIEALLTESNLHWNYAVGIAKRMFQKEALEFCTENELWRIVASLEYRKKRVTHETGRISTQATRKP
ncbi:TPA: regulatory protein GemA [Acinetobacter baumannii]|uniref:gp16 family protein n=1 Tax=Acinetobacter baumannii TaxID=470 RepID=UPI001D8F68A3|nr:regulatory protein GemA [Acinetobacter baumannii]MCF1301083.1 regulatory protein GemA [Acinetobacter baumannii]HAV4522537.1 DUF1018 domain-containing protein [Acinetobacter baumannii]HAV4564033.1 DUF1018 domain-containing protein [Acinetobacter baumannii]HBI8999070.1 regulatory protein GemA [Acinetobacter baumannii]